MLTCAFSLNSNNRNIMKYILILYLTWHMLASVYHLSVVLVIGQSVAQLCLCPPKEARLNKKKILRAARSRRTASHKCTHITALESRDRQSYRSQCNKLSLELAGTYAFGFPTSIPTLCRIISKWGDGAYNTYSV